MMIPSRLTIAHLPTPVEPLPRLSAFLGGPQLWVKRDDLTGLALGGNKTRKLEYLLADAQAQGAKTLITAGAAQSNHCRQTAAAAARFGFDCLLVLSEEPPSRMSGNILLDCLFGAELVWSPRSEREQALQRAFTAAQDRGRKPYLIPYGGSNPTGAAAYAIALQELLAQITPDWILFASSSGGTQAGLALGARLCGFQGHILGISVDEPSAELAAHVAQLATATGVQLGEQVSFTPDEIMVNADFLGAGYGVMGAPEVEAIQLFARQEGLLLDPVYTGRAAAGMIGLIRQGFFQPDERVLFWHTGGIPALFVDQYSSSLTTS